MKMNFKIFAVGALLQSSLSMALPEMRDIQWEGLRQMHCSSGNFSVTLWKKGPSFEVSAVDSRNEELPKLLLHNVPVEMAITEIFPPEGLFRDASGRLIVKGHGQGRRATLHYIEEGVKHSVVIENCEYEVAE